MGAGDGTRGFGRDLHGVGDGELMFVVKLVAERNTFNIRHTSSQCPTAPFAPRQKNGFLHPLQEGCFVLCP